MLDSEIPGLPSVTIRRPTWTHFSWTGRRGASGIATPEPHDGIPGAPGGVLTDADPGSLRSDSIRAGARESRRAGAGLVFANLDSAASPTSLGSDLAGHTPIRAVESPLCNRTFRTREITAKLARAATFGLNLGEKPLTSSSRRRYASEMEAEVGVFRGVFAQDTLHYIYLIEY